MENLIEEILKVNGFTTYRAHGVDILAASNTLVFGKQKGASDVLTEQKFGC